jgi:hypothetical protein
MIVSIDTRIPFPRPLVYATYRDKLVELIPYLPNVRSLEVKSRREVGGEVHCVNEWHGGGEIPLAVRAVLSEKMLSWTEYNIWNETDFTLAWKIETHAFTKAVLCEGQNHFIEEGKTTLIKSQGKLIIDPQKIEGVPKFLSGRVAHIVENFLGQKIQPNLLQMSEGVRHYLERQSSQAY